MAEQRHRRNAAYQSSSYSFPAELHEELQRRANATHNGNRSKLAEDCIRRGLAAMDAEERA